MDGDLTFGVAIKSTGDGSVVADAKSATSELENMKKATDELAASQVKMASQSRASEDDIMRYYTGLSVAEDNAKAKAWALANGYQEAGGQMVKATEAAADGMGKLSIGTHRAYQEMVVLAREAARGNFSRMASSGSILLSQLTPLGLGIAGVTALVAAGAYAYEKMTNAVDAETAAAQENDKQFQALSASLRDQNVLLERRIQLAAGGQVASVTGLSNEEVNKMFELEQTITRIKGDMADGVKIGHDGFYLSEELAQNQKKLNELLDEANGKQEKNNQLKAQSQGKNLGADAEKELGKTYADAQRLDAQMVGSHQSAFDKTIAAWISMKQKMEAVGIYYGQLREEHEAAYTAFVNAENLKRNTAAEAAAKKKSDAEAQHQAAAINSEKKYFAEIQAAADAASMSAGGKEKLRYDRELITLNAQHKKTADAVKNDHAAALAEEAAYQIALGNLKKTYALQTYAEDITVHEMALAFTQGNQREEIESTLNYLTKLSAMGASHHRGMFELNKRASEATAIMNAYEGISGVLKEFPGPVGWGMAVAQAALGFAQVDAIESTQFGGGAANSGGGGIPSLAPSPGVPVTPASPKLAAVSSTPAAPVQAPQQLNITVIGAKANPDKAVLSFNALVDIVNGINQVGARGYKINAHVIAG